MLSITEPAAASLMLDKRWVTLTITAQLCDRYSLMLTKKQGVLMPAEGDRTGMVRAVWLGKDANFSPPSLKRYREETFLKHYADEVWVVFVFTAETVWFLAASQVAQWATQGYIVDGKIKRSRLLSLLEELKGDDDEASKASTVEEAARG